MSRSQRGKVLAFRTPVPAVTRAESPSMEDTISDEALVAACALGDGSALGVLFDRHSEALFRFMSRLTAPAAASDVEDLVQNTFLEVWRAASRYRGQGRVRSWIFGIAANLSRRHARGEARRRGALAVLAGKPASAGVLPDDEAAHRQLVDRLAQMLPSLSHDLRVVFLLCDVEELPGVEVARALGVREGTLWRRLHDARKRLRGLVTGRTS